MCVSGAAGVLFHPVNCHLISSALGILRAILELP
jgi:hypothetical protein